MRYPLYAHYFLKLNAFIKYYNIYLIVNCIILRIFILLISECCFKCLGCYGVQENISLSSTTSSCSTEPWFCESCRAGVINPTCELCPAEGMYFDKFAIIYTPS